MDQKRELRFGSIIVGLFWVSQACCAADKELAELMLEEVVVTATKRAEALQSIPLSVTAFTGATLNQKGAESFADYARSVPSLTFTDFGLGRQRVAVRGIDSKIGSTVVGYYLDETLIPDSSSASAERVSFDPSLIDMERVEILRGPQGTMYGAGSMGGTIRIIPKAPVLTEREASLNSMMSTTQSSGAPALRANAVLNTPLIVGRLGFRLSAWYRDNEGFVRRRSATPASLAANRAAGSPLVFKENERVPDEVTYGGRAVLRFQANARTVLEASLFSEDQDFAGFQDITTGPLNPGDDLVQNFLFDFQERNRNRLSIANVKGLFDVGFADIVSSVSYSRRLLSIHQEAAAALESLGIVPAFNALPIYEEAIDKAATAEVRMSSKGEGRLQWLTGVFYSDQDGATLMTWRPAGFSDNLFPLAGDNLFSGEFLYTIRQKAAFAELSYPVFKKLRLTAGARAFDFSRRDYLGQNGLVTGVEAAAWPDPYADPPAIGAASGTVFKFDAGWRHNERLLIYAHAAEGFRGGYGRVPVPDTCAADLVPLGEQPGRGQVQPDKLWNYELGVKSGVLQNRLRVNAAGYLIDWKNIQNAIFLPCGFQLGKNLGNLRNYGGEVEIEGVIRSGLTVGASAGYVRSALQEDIYGIPGTKGRPLPDIPRLSSAAFVAYEFPLANGWTAVARTDFSYTDGSVSVYTLGGGTTPDKAALNLWDARLALQRGRFTVSLFARNLLNDVGRIALERDATLNVADRLRYTVDVPRTIGLGFVYSGRWLALSDAP